MSFLSSLFSPLKGVFDKDNWFGASINLTNTMVGAGILFLPFIVKTNGIILGFGALALGCACFIYSKALLCLTLNEARRKGVKPPETLELLVKAVFGDIVYQIIKIMILFYLFGVLIAYQSILRNMIVDFMETIYPESEIFTGDNNVFTFGVMLGCTLVMAIAAISEKMRHLRYIGMASLITLYIFMGCVFLLFFSTFTSPMTKGEVRYLPDLSNIKVYPYLILYTGTVTLAFGANTVTTIHSEFEDENLWKVMVAIINSHVYTLIIYCTISIFGYLSFLDNTKENLVLSYSIGSSDVQKLVSYFLKILIFVQLAFSSPTKTHRLGLSLYNAVVEIKNFIFGLFTSKSVGKVSKKREEEEEDGSEKTYTRLVMFSITKLIALIVAGTIAWIYPDSLSIVSYVGAVVGTIISHLLQQCMYLKYVETNLVQKMGIYFGLLFTTVVLGVVPFVFKFMDDWEYIEPPY